MISQTYYRTLYSKDWCRQHPEGTVGDFHRDFDSLDASALQVSLFIHSNKELTNMFLAVYTTGKKDAHRGQSRGSHGNILMPDTDTTISDSEEATSSLGHRERPHRQTLKVFPPTPASPTSFKLQVRPPWAFHRRQQLRGTLDVMACNSL
jgi:hypothetical protein